jgi:hypothetical protein
MPPAVTPVVPSLLPALASVADNRRAAGRWHACAFPIAEPLAADVAPHLEPPRAICAARRAACISQGACGRI